MSEVTILAQFTVRRLTNLNNRSRWFVEINGIRLDPASVYFSTREQALNLIETYWHVKPEHVTVHP